MLLGSSPAHGDPFLQSLGYLPRAGTGEALWYRARLMFHLLSSFHLVRTLPTCLRPYRSSFLWSFCRFGPNWTHSQQTSRCRLPLPSRPSSPAFGSCLPCRTPGRLGFVQRFPPGGEDCVSRGPPHSGPMLGIRLAARAVRGGGQSISQQVGRDSRHRQLGLPPSLSSNALPSSRAIGVVPRVPRNSAVRCCWKS